MGIGMGIKTYICVVIFCEDVEVALIYGGFHAVEFTDVGVFDPIYSHLTA